MKKFNSDYKLTDIHTMDFDRLFVSVVVACNESDVRSIFEYKTDDIRVIPLYVKSSANCCSNSVSQYNENSAWKMALDISDDEKWMERNMTLSKEIEARLDGSETCPSSENQSSYELS